MSHSVLVLVNPYIYTYDIVCIYKRNEAKRMGLQGNLVLRLVLRGVHVISVLMFFPVRFWHLSTKFNSRCRGPDPGPSLRELASAGTVALLNCGRTT